MRLTNAGSPSQTRGARRARHAGSTRARSCLELEPVNLLAQAGEVVRLALRNVKLARAAHSPSAAARAGPRDAHGTQVPLRRRALGLGRAVPETGRARGLRSAKHLRDGALLRFHLFVQERELVIAADELGAEDVALVDHDIIPGTSARFRVERRDLRARPHRDGAVGWETPAHSVFCLKRSRSASSMMRSSSRARPRSSSWRPPR